MTRSPSSAPSVAKNRASINVSVRLPRALGASDLAIALETIAPPYDLTLSNPTRAGLIYPEDAIAEALGRAARVPYVPDSLGSPVARQFLASVTGVEASRILLTASTSEAYAIALKTFVAPGEAVAVPRPSYPLVPHLAELEGVRCVPWLLREDGVDLASIRDALNVGARMVIVVSPNNPTGAIVAPSELYAIAEMCAGAGAVLTVDGVFGQFIHDRSPASVPRDLPGTTLVMDGLSKRAGLPQLKVAWTCVLGDVQAMDALAWTNDAYLSCGFAQHALPELFACGEKVAAQIRRRIAGNLVTLRSAFADVPEVSVPAVAAGWTALVRVPAVMDEDAWVIACAREGVRVQPGYFYDLDVGAHLVVSLLPDARDFAEGIARVARVVRANV